MRTCAGTPCLATRVALHVSQQMSSESWGFSGVAAVSRYTPPKKPLVAPVALQLPGVSHFKLPLSEVSKRGLADRGGWRKEIPPIPQIQAPFLPPFFPCSPMSRKNISGGHFLLYFGRCWSPTPSRQPLFETSDSEKVSRCRGV